MWWLGFSSGEKKTQIIWTYFSWLSDWGLMQTTLLMFVDICGEAGIGVVWPSFHSMISQQLLIPLITGIGLFVSKWCGHKGECHMTTLCSNGNSPYCLCLSENCGQGSPHKLWLSTSKVIGDAVRNLRVLGDSQAGWQVRKWLWRPSEYSQEGMKMPLFLFLLFPTDLCHLLLLLTGAPSLTIWGPHEGPVWPLEKGLMWPAAAFWRARLVTPHQQQEEEDGKGQLEVAEWVVIKWGLSECFVFNDVMNFSPQFLRHV